MADIRCAGINSIRAVLSANAVNDISEFVLSQFLSIIAVPDILDTVFFSANNFVFTNMVVFGIK